LPSLGYADAPADDLSDCFTLTQTPITFQTIPAPLDAARRCLDGISAQWDKALDRLKLFVEL